MTISMERKKEYFAKLTGYLDNYTRILLVQLDNVGSKQIQEIRIALRGQAEILMGKNTMIRRVLADYIEANPGHPVEQIVEHLKGNVGFVFTNGDLGKIREVIDTNKVPAPARVGSIAPIDVLCPAGPTGCDPGQTSFFQTLNIATKINRGQIEIVSETVLTKAGEKVGNSEATLCQKLGIRPFEYGLVLKVVYDNGSCFDPAVLDLTDDDLVAKFSAGARNVAAVSLALGFPTLASVPHSIYNAFKNLVAIAVECESFSFAKADPYKAYLADPSAFAAAAGPAAGGAGGDAAAAAAPVEEEEEEEAPGGAGGMFGDDGDGDY